MDLYSTMTIRNSAENVKVMLKLCKSESQMKETAELLVLQDCPN